MLPHCGTFISVARDAAQESYVNHLLEVAMLVAEATDGKDPDLVIATLLHDAIEDQEVPRTIIAGAFGDGLTRLVEEVTDDKSLENAHDLLRVGDRGADALRDAAVLREDGERAFGIGGVDHVAEADAHVEDLEHYAVVDAGVALDQGKFGCGSMSRSIS
jgi:hypothetical protein